jgi:hypothetical protein
MDEDVSDAAWEALAAAACLTKAAKLLHRSRSAGVARFCSQSSTSAANLASRKMETIAGTFQLDPEGFAENRKQGRLISSSAVGPCGHAEELYSGCKRPWMTNTPGIHSQFKYVSNCACTLLHVI